MVKRRHIDCKLNGSQPCGTSAGRPQACWATWTATCHPDHRRLQSMCPGARALWLLVSEANFQRDVDTWNISRGRRRGLWKLRKKGWRMAWKMVACRPIQPQTLCSAILVLKFWGEFDGLWVKHLSGQSCDLSSSCLFMPVPFTELCYLFALWALQFENSQAD